mgnify:CR=1 FL=1
MTKEAAATSIIMVPIEQIIPYEQNVKIHRSVQVRKVANSIESYGWDQPIVVDEGMVIIKGHARLAAAQLLELREVPVIVRTDLTEEEKRLSRIMDNKSAESEWDNEFLWQEISHLKSQGMKVQDLGFSDKNIVDMFPGRAQEVTKAPKEDIVHQTVAAGADGHDPTIPIIEVTLQPFRGEAFFRPRDMPGHQVHARHAAPRAREGHADAPGAAGRVQHAVAGFHAQQFGHGLGQEDPVADRLGILDLQQRAQVGAVAQLARIDAEDALDGDRIGTVGQGGDEVGVLGKFGADPVAGGDIGLPVPAGADQVRDDEVDPVPSRSTSGQPRARRQNPAGNPSASTAA